MRLLSFIRREKHPTVCPIQTAGSTRSFLQTPISSTQLPPEQAFLRNSRSKLSRQRVSSFGLRHVRISSHIAAFAKDADFAQVLVFQIKHIVFLLGGGSMGQYSYLTVFCTS